jgi:hypothetical protein
MELLFGPIVLPTPSAQVTRAFTLRLLCTCTQSDCPLRPPRRARRLHSGVQSEHEYLAAVPTVNTTAPAHDGREKASPPGWKKLDAPDPHSRMRILLIPNRRPPLLIWDVVDALGRKAAGANASTFARPLIRRCYTSSSIDVGEILHPAPPMARAANDHSQKAHLATRIVRNGLLGQSCSSPAHIGGPAAVARARWYVLSMPFAGRPSSILPAKLRHGRALQGSALYLTLESTSAAVVSSRARLSSLLPVRAAQLRGVGKNSPRRSLMLAPCLSHATSDDVFSQKVSPGSPRRSPGPVAWLRRSLWLVAVWGVSDASHTLAACGQASPNSWV